jgi:aminopeptidase S
MAIRLGIQRAIGAALLLAVVGACADAPGLSPPEPTVSAAPPSARATPSASASDPAPPASIPPAADALTSEALRDAVTVAGIRVHLEELQRIADANGGNRATGTTGFDASVAYVERRLVDAGYQVERQLFVAGTVSSTNLLVDTGETVGGEVVMFGAHVDSVLAGPGINDNGSGLATLLVVAERLAELPPPDRPVRFAFWGAEENGPFGSAAYVGQLTEAERGRIRAYLNFDMLGSPNFIRFVYSEAHAAAGSQGLTDLFGSYFEDEGLAWEPVDLTGHADHGPFVAAAIPTGGLFGGGSEPKTDAQAVAFGGTAGESADACSHLACDTIANISDVALDEMSDAVAHAVATLASD